MSNHTEKVFREFEKFLTENGGAETEEELAGKFEQFKQEYNRRIRERGPLREENAETADDYLELAQEAESPEEMLRLAEEAYRLAPDNLDAPVMVTVLTEADPFERLGKYEKLIRREEKSLRKQGYFDEEYSGEFWLAHQTRPYMRARKAYIEELINLCMFEAAEKECMEMLELCENDNIGVRYTLMHIYALQGNEEKARELHKRYPEDGAMMLMPLAVLYYRKKSLNEALKYLRRIMKYNPDLKEFLSDAAEEGDPIPDDCDPRMYRPFTMDELQTAVFENEWLYTAAGWFFVWADREINTKNSRKTKKKKS